MSTIWIDTGQTLVFVRDYLIQRGAVEVNIAVLLDKKARGSVEVICRFIGKEVNNHFLDGYGLDGGNGFAQNRKIFYANS